MRSLNRAFSLLTLLAWLFASGHVALHHGGCGDSSAHLSSEAHDDHDRDAPGHDGEEHHHDLTATAAGPWVKAADDHTIIKPALRSLYDVLVQRVSPAFRDVDRFRPLSILEHSPPDARASGWLLVCHSALPVRGPSLAV